MFLPLLLLFDRQSVFQELKFYFFLDLFYLILSDLQVPAGLWSTPNITQRRSVLGVLVLLYTSLIHFRQLA